VIIYFTDSNDIVIINQLFIKCKIKIDPQSNICMIEVPVKA